MVRPPSQQCPAQFRGGLLRSGARLRASAGTEWGRPGEVLRGRQPASQGIQGGAAPAAERAGQRGDWLYSPERKGCNSACGSRRVDCRKWSGRVEDKRQRNTMRIRREYEENTIEIPSEYEDNTLATG